MITYTSIKSAKNAIKNTNESILKLKDKKLKI